MAKLKIDIDLEKVSETEKNKELAKLLGALADQFARGEFNAVLVFEGKYTVDLKAGGNTVGKMKVS